MGRGAALVLGYFHAMNLLRNLGAFVCAFLAGSVTMLVLHQAHMVIWPEEAMPSNSATTEEFRAWMSTLSMTTLIAATIVHWLGTMVGVAVGTLVAARSGSTGNRAMWPAYVMGGWFFIGGIANAIQLGTPMWLTVLDAAGYVPLAILTGRLMQTSKQDEPIRFV